MEMKSQLREMGDSDNDPTNPWYFDVHVRWQTYKIWACAQLPLVEVDQALPWKCMCEPWACMGLDFFFYRCGY